MPASDHIYRVMLDGACERLGVSAAVRHVSLKTAPSIQVMRKDFNFLAQGVILAVNSNGRIGCSMPRFIAELQKSEKIIGRIADAVEKTAKQCGIEDGMDAKMEYDAHVPHPMMMRYLQTIEKADAAVALVLSLMINLKIGDELKRQYYSDVIRALRSIKIAATGIEPYRNNDGKPREKRQNGLAHDGDRLL